jgi:hypothetical protein
VNGVGTVNVVAVESLQAAASTTTAGVTTEAAVQAPAVNSCSTVGTQDVAVLMMNQGAGGAAYPLGITPTYLQNEYFSSTPKSLPTYWNETSPNLTSASGQVFVPFTLDRVYTCAETNALATKAIALAQAGGVDLSGYSRVSIVFPTDNSCGFGGLGDVGCRAPDAQVTHPYSVSWIPIFSTYTGATDLWGTLAHELGHNLGLGHGNSLDFGTTTLGTLDYKPIPPNGGATSSNTAVNLEYGDKFSVMGLSQCGGQYSAFAKTQYLDWLPFSDFYETTSGGNFILSPFEVTGGPRAVRVLRDAATSSWLWLEYRQPQGAYDSLLQGCLPGTNVYQGALGYYESPGSTDGHLFLLDFHPSATPNDFKNAALLPGESWSDPFSPISLNVTNANASGMSVSVSYNQPCHSAVASAPTFAANGATGSIFVTAPSDCSWQASTGTSWLSFTGATSGTGSGFVPFSLSNNTGAEQRLGFVTVSRISVPVSQKGTATYIKPMSPSLGSGIQAAIPFTFDNPLGSTDVNYARIIFGNTEMCEIDMSQSSGFVGFFIWDASTQSFSPFIAPGDNVTYGTSACSLTGTGTTVTHVGNQLQVTLNMSFNLNFAGSHRVAVSACDGAFPFTCSSDITVGTWQVPLTAAINQLTPSTGKQGTSLSVTAFGTNTHFSDTSTIVVSGTGVTVTGISAFSPTQISGTFNIDAAAAAGVRTVTIASGAEVLTTGFTVGASGQVSVAPATLMFTKQAVGTTSAPLHLILTNTGSASLAISSINAVGEFGSTHNCGMSLAVNASCTINITFSPSFGGYRHGNVIINDDSAGAPHFVAITGMGEASLTILRPGRDPRPTTTTIAQNSVRSLSVALPASRSADANVSCQAGGSLKCSITSVSYGVSGPVYDLEIRSAQAKPGRYNVRLLTRSGRSKLSYLIPVEVEKEQGDEEELQ